MKEEFLVEIIYGTSLVYLPNRKIRSHKCAEWEVSWSIWCECEKKLNDWNYPFLFCWKTKTTLRKPTNKQREIGKSL